MEHLREQWRKLAKAEVFYRGMHVIVDEGRDPFDGAAVLAGIERGRALMNGGEATGYGIHWTSSRQVAESFSRAKAPAPVPAPLKGPRGVLVEDTYYRGPRGTGVSVVLEAAFDRDIHQHEPGNVYVPKEEEVSPAPGAQVRLLGMYVYDGTRWRQLHVPSRLVTAGKPVSEMSESEFRGKRFLYHGTNSKEDLRKLLNDGVRMANVPMNLARQRYQSGEYAEYAPGAGVGIGLYASGDVYQASQFGRNVVAIEVTERDYVLPPESSEPGYKIEWALKDANGVLINKDIPASRVHLVIEQDPGTARYVYDAFKDSRK